MKQKHQIPSSNLHRNSKHQNSKTLCLEFGIWSFPGAWILELGYSIGLLLLVVLRHLRHTFLDFLAVFEVAPNCAVAARDNLVALLQSFHNLPVGIVTDADFHRNHFRPLTVSDENDFNRFGGFLRFFVALVGISA